MTMPTLTIFAGEPLAVAELHAQTGIFALFSLLKDRVLVTPDAWYFIAVADGKYLDLRLVALHIVIVGLLAYALWRVRRHPSEVAFGQKILLLIVVFIQLSLITFSLLLNVPFELEGVVIVGGVCLFVGLLLIAFAGRRSLEIQ